MTDWNEPTPFVYASYAYDSAGNLEAKKDGNGLVTAYEYDDLNRLVAAEYGYGSNAWPAQVSYPLNSAQVTYAYDSAGTVTKTNPTGSAVYEYDGQNRLVSYTPPVPSQHGDVTFTYNNLGQKTSVTNGSQVVHYDYFANGWLKAVTDGAEQNPFVYADYEYDQVGNRTRVDLGNTTYTTYAYDTDPRYRVDTIAHIFPSDTATICYYNPGPGDPRLRDGAGNPRYMHYVDSAGQVNVSYDYDNNSRLTSAETGYAYDWVGNRNPSTHTYNAADELVVSPDHQYGYDSAGNLTYEYDSSGQTLQKTYSYTPAGLLESVVHAGIGTSSMAWDADGNRVSFTSSTGGTWQFVYQPKAIAPAVIEEITPSGSVFYVREPNGALIARISGSGQGQTICYYHFDAIGSTRVLTDSAGAVTDKYTYDAWGNASHTIGSTEQPYQFVGQLGCYTHYQDQNLPALEMGVRLCSPEEGRFTQLDPARLGRNLYAYVDNRVTTLVDAFGLDSGPVSFHNCQQAKGSRTVTWAVYCGKKQWYEDWSGFNQCVSQRVGWGNLAVTGVQAAVCAASCSVGLVGGGTMAYAACFAQCMGMGNPDFAPTCGDMAEVYNCWKENREWTPADPYIVHKCTFWAGNTFVEVYDRNPDPPGGGWKLCGGEIFKGKR